jgi:hypothetical protein
MQRNKRDEPSPEWQGMPRCRLGPGRAYTRLLNGLAILGGSP